MDIRKRLVVSIAAAVLGFAGSVTASSAEEPIEVWVKVFPVYDNAVELCSGCVMAGPGKGGITFTKYTTTDAPTKVLQFYRQYFKTSGDSFKDPSGMKSLSVDVVGGKNQPTCAKEAKVPAAAKSVIIVSVRTSAGAKPAPKAK